MGAIYVVYTTTSQPSPMWVVALDDVSGRELDRISYQPINGATWYAAEGDYGAGKLYIPTGDNVGGNVGHVEVFDTTTGTFTNPIILGASPGSTKSTPTGLVYYGGALYVSFASLTNLAKTPIQKIDPATGNVLQHFFCDPLTNNAGANDGARFASLTPDGKTLRYINTASKFHVGQHDVINDIALPRFINDSVDTRQISGSLESMATVRTMTNGQVVLTGAFIIKLYDANANLLATRQWDLPGTVESPSIHIGAAVDTRGQWLYAASSQFSPDSTTRADLFRLPLDLTAPNPTLPFFHPNPPLVDGIGVGLGEVSITQTDVVPPPLRWRQRPDCLTPGSAMPCICFRLAPTEIVCIPPWWIIITSGVQFGGNVGPRNNFY